MGGKSVPSNLQTLCKQCNSIKGVNEINYQSIVSPLHAPKDIILFDSVNSDYIENTMSRIVNHIYHCRALCNMNYSKIKSGKYYDTWEITLYHGNNPSWLENYSAQLLDYIQHYLGWNHVRKLKIKA
jgi:hypothetical protein